MLDLASPRSNSTIYIIQLYYEHLTTPRVTKVVEIVLCVWALVRFAVFNIQILDKSAAGPAS
jgi:hypothetical protein